MMREDWVETKLGRVLFLTKEKYKSEEIEELFYVGLEHIEKETGKLASNAGVTSISTVKNKFEKGQILYGKLRPYLNKVHLANRGGVCSTDILVFEPNEAINAKYALNFMLSRKFVNDMSANTSGVNLPRVSTKFVNNYTVPLAPLPEQRAIVAKIEKLFSDLDNGITNLIAAKAKIEIYRAAVLHHAFENQDLESIRLEEVVEDHMIGTVRSGKDQNNAGNGVPYIKMNNVDLYGNVDLDDIVYVEVDTNELNKYKLNNGDILINNRNSYELVGKTGIVKNIKSAFVFNNNLLRIRVKKGINASFVAYQLISPLVRNQMREGRNATTNVCALYQRNIFPLRIKTAQLQEQHAIVAAIESRLSVCDKLAESIDQSLEKAEALRQSILKKAFAGQLLNDAELAACRREPDWEPAHKLLEKIQKNR